MLFCSMMIYERVVNTSNLLKLFRVNIFGDLMKSRS